MSMAPDYPNVETSGFMTTLDSELDRDSLPSKARYISDLLFNHGEVIIRAASGKVLEVHTGDDFVFDQDFLVVSLPHADYHLAYDQIESVTTHVAHLE